MKNFTQWLAEDRNNSVLTMENLDMLVEEYVKFYQEDIPYWFPPEPGTEPTRPLSVGFEGFGTRNHLSKAIK